MKRRYALVAILILAPACGLFGPRDPVRVEVLGDNFERRSAYLGASVPFVVENLGKRSVFLEQCGQRVMASVERRVGPRWEQYSGDACTTAVSRVRLEVPPGARVEASRVILDPGRFRLRPGVEVGSGVDWSYASRAFEVR